MLSTRGWALTGLLVWAMGCGAKVVTSTSGSGSTGAETASSSGGTPITTITGSDPACPSDPAVLHATACPTEGQTCIYTTGACVLTFTCINVIPDPNDNFFCGATPLEWSAPDASACGGCAGGAGCVVCNDAALAAPCDAVGFECEDTEGGGNCGAIKLCDVDHAWVYIDQPGCCI